MWGDPAFGLDRPLLSHDPVPQIVVVHRRDPVRRMGERHAAPLQFGDGQRDVGAAEIDAALRPEFRRVRRLVEQQAHAGAVKK